MLELQDENSNLNEVINDFGQARFRKTSKDKSKFVDISISRDNSGIDIKVRSTV